MKYPNPQVTIPREKRAALNQKILQIIDSGKDVGITPEDIFLAYTGDGGLHGLQASNYGSYHAYSEAKKEIEQGQFFTPHAVSEFIMNCLQPSATDLIADLTCGMGNFANYAPVESNFYGNELDIKAFKIARFLYPKAIWTCEDIRYYRPNVTFDLIVGNPPFNLQWKVGKDEYVSQIYYCMKAHELLKPAGLLAVIVPESFLADDFLDAGHIRMMEDRFSFVTQLCLPDEVFSPLGVKSFRTKLMIWQKRTEAIETTPFTVDSFIGVPVTQEAADRVHTIFVLPALAKRDAVKHKLLFEQAEHDREEREFSYTVRKLLFDIKRNPKLREKYGKAENYVHRYYTEKKPDEMKWEEWEQKRLTKPKVLAYLKRVVREQHQVEEDKIALVKTQYGLKWKAYSAKTRLQLGKQGGPKEVYFADMVYQGDYPFSDPRYKNLVARKQRSYQMQDQLLSEMTPSVFAQAFVNAFSLYDSALRQTIRLNPMQKLDIARFLDKPIGGILNWEQGAGKTLGAIAWYHYLKDRVQNTFVVGPAIAINLTWEVRLKNYGEDFVTIRSLSDLARVAPGQVVLTSFNMLSKYQKQIQKWVRIRSNNIAVVVDESDELTNHTSKRTRATLACFRRAKHKLLTTGTTTRNNIGELYAQLEFIYNNSENMMCLAPYTYERDKEGELVEKDNPYYERPFPAYHGNSLFRASFCPFKVTVFGVKQYKQDIYNRDALEHLVGKTILTRSFEEVVGEKKHSIVTHRIEQNVAEREIYRKIMREFLSMLHYFRSTGNTRKDSMLRLIRQIQLLIKSTSMPHHFDEYDGDTLPNKFTFIQRLIAEHPEKVALGTVFLDTAEEYATYLQLAFPERPVFLIKGDVTFKARKGLISEFEATRDGILVSTQQSLKSSVSIPTCNSVIVESIPWNVPKLSQYFMRFVRYDSTEHKTIHLVTYDWTIEQNIVAFLMAKQRINEFIKTLDFKEESEIFEEYGVDMNILSALIEKQKDEDGHVHLTWGAQKVS